MGDEYVGDLRYMWEMDNSRDVGCVGVCGRLRRCGLFIQEVLHRCVHCAGFNWPPNHPGGVVLIKGKNKRLGCEPMRKE